MRGRQVGRCRSHPFSIASALGSAYPWRMASITLDIKSELPKAVAWTDAMTKQLPFAISQALNQTAFDVRTALNGATNQYFDRPNRFTQSAFLYQRSSKRDLTATVYANADQGRDRARYLRYGIQGGQRRQKGFEKKFLADVAATGRIPAGVHLHDSHRGLHRRSSSPRTLIAVVTTISLFIITTRRSKNGSTCQDCR